MQSPSEWQIVVLRGLKAHFKDPDGPSRPGTDWLVALRNDAQEYRIVVRAYADDVAGIAQDREVAMVLDFVTRLLGQGWTPDEWKGQPGELTLSGSQADRATDTRRAKPWWRFW